MMSRSPIQRKPLAVGVCSEYQLLSFLKGLLIFWCFMLCLFCGVCLLYPYAGVHCSDGLGVAQKGIDVHLVDLRSGSAESRHAADDLVEEYQVDSFLAADALEKLEAPEFSSASIFETGESA